MVYLSFLLVELTEGSDDYADYFLLCLDGQMLPARHPRYIYNSQFVQQKTFVTTKFFMNYEWTEYDFF